MAPRKRKATKSAEQAAADESAAQAQKDIHIQASATVGHTEGTTHVTGAVVTVSDAQTVHVGDTVAGDKVLGDQVFGDKNVSITHQAPEQNITNQAPNYGAQGIFQGPVYVGTSSPAPIDPLQQAQELFDRLPLNIISAPASLPPHSRMPLARNPLFVGREADLKQLAVTLQGGGTAAIGQIAAATGLGGIGKTNLATEFVHRYGQYFTGGVFWLSFADAAGVPAEVAACGVGLALPGFENLKLDDQVARVRQLWQEPIPRLLIFDNCEDEVLLDQWRPTSGGCRVLVTGRRARWDIALGVRVLALGVLSRSESIALLRKHRLDLAEDDPDLDLIAAELGDLPLALHLAGSYLARYRQAVTVAEYLAQLRSPVLLQHRSLRLAGVSPTGHDHDVGRTFALSYNRLDPADTIDALALALLARAAYFAPGEPIPRDLLIFTVEFVGDEVTLEAEDALIRLIDLGLLEWAEEGTLRLHRLLVVFVQAVAQDEEALAAVEQGIYEVTDWVNWEGLPGPLLTLQGHLRFVTDRAMVHDNERAARLCSALGCYLRMIGEYHSARFYAERALVIWRKVPGEQYLDTAASLNNLGLLLKDMGDLSGARAYYEQALAIKRKVLGEQHLDTALSLNNLGTLLRDVGDLSGARSHLEQALAIFKRVPGEDHSDTALSLNNLGLLLKDMGDLSGARAYYEQALAIRQRLLGEDHPSTATSLNNLGRLLQDMGDLSGARAYYEQALAIFKRVLGEDHPSTATSLNNLGGLLKTQGDLSGARVYYEQALAIFKGVLGPDHPNTRTVRGNLADLDALAQTLAQQIAQIVQQADAMVETALGEGNTEACVELAEWLEQQAQLAEDGEEPGSPYLDLAAHLRGLIVRLREGDGADESGADAQGQAGGQQIAEIRQRVDAAVARVLAGGEAEAREALMEKLTVTADAYVSGNAAERVLAEYLRALVARLSERDDGDRLAGAG